MKKYQGDFGQELFSELLTRKDLAHLLLTDIEESMANIAKEFSDVVSLETIGKTWESREIKVMKIDARKKLENVDTGIEKSPAKDKDEKKDEQKGEKKEEGEKKEGGKKEGGKNLAETSKKDDLTDDDLMEQREEETRKEK